MWIHISRACLHDRTGRQHLVEKHFRRRRLPEARARRVVLHLNQRMNPLGKWGSPISRVGDYPAQPADGVFNPTRLPEGVRVAEEWVHPEGMAVVRSRFPCQHRSKILRKVLHFVCELRKSGIGVFVDVGKSKILDSR